MSRLLALLKPRAEQCIVISFDHAAMTYVRHHSALATGWVLHALRHCTPPSAGDGLRPDLLICNHLKITPGQMPGKNSALDVV